MALLDFIATAFHRWESDDCGQPPRRVDERLPVDLDRGEDRSEAMSHLLRDAAAPHFARPFEPAAGSSFSQW